MSTGFLALIHIQLADGARVPGAGAVTVVKAVG